MVTTKELHEEMVADYLMDTKGETIRDKDKIIDEELRREAEQEMLMETDG